MRIVWLFGVVAIAELATFVVVESQIGLGNALLIALATAILGSMLVRRAGLTVMGDIRRRLDAGGFPGRELTHGAAVLVAGALLISPGFLTDTIGFLLLVPSVRDLVHARLAKRYGDRLVGHGDDGSPPPPDDVIVVEGWEVEEVDPS